MRQSIVQACGVRPRGLRRFVGAPMAVEKR